MCISAKCKIKEIRNDRNTQFKLKHVFTSSKYMENCYYILTILTSRSIRNLFLVSNADAWVMLINLVIFQIKMRKCPVSFSRLQNITSFFHFPHIPSICRTKTRSRFYISLIYQLPNYKTATSIFFSFNTDCIMFPQSLYQSYDKDQSN